MDWKKITWLVSGVSGFLIGAILVGSLYQFGALTTTSVGTLPSETGASPITCTTKPEFASSGETFSIMMNFTNIVANDTVNFLARRTADASSGNNAGMFVNVFIDGNAVVSSGAISAPVKWSYTFANSGIVPLRADIMDVSGKTVSICEGNPFVAAYPYSASDIVVNCQGLISGDTEKYRMVISPGAPKVGQEVTITIDQYAGHNFGAYGSYGYGDWGRYVEGWLNGERVIWTLDISDFEPANWKKTFSSAGNNTIKIDVTDAMGKSGAICEKTFSVASSGKASNRRDTRDNQ